MAYISVTACGCYYERHHSAWHGVLSYAISYPVDPLFIQLSSFMIGHELRLWKLCTCLFGCLAHLTTQKRWPIYKVAEGAWPGINYICDTMRWPLTLHLDCLSNTVTVHDYAFCHVFPRHTVQKKLQTIPAWHDNNNVLPLSGNEFAIRALQDIKSSELTYIDIFLSQV